MDYIQAFKDLFENREFSDFHEFKDILDKYMKDNSVIYVLGSSRKSSNRRLKYEKVSMLIY